MKFLLLAFVALIHPCAFAGEAVRIELPVYFSIQSDVYGGASITYDGKANFLMDSETRELLAGQMDVSAIYRYSSGGRGWPTRYTLSPETLRLSSISKRLSTVRSDRRKCPRGQRGSVVLYTPKLTLAAPDLVEILEDAERLGRDHYVGSALEALRRSNLNQKTADGSKPFTIQPLSGDIRPFRVSAIIPADEIVGVCSP